MKDIQFTAEDVSEVLKYVKNLSSPGPDEISQRVMKEVADDVSLPLSIPFNKLLQSGEVPLDWKTANVVPIYKSEPKCEPVNYRPITGTENTQPTVVHAPLTLPRKTRPPAKFLQCASCKAVERPSLKRSQFGLRQQFQKLV